jgi:hypothetical protein
MSNYRKSVLTGKTRIAFDPRNKKHMLDFAKFVKYNNWKEGCSYYLEQPFTDIPAMIRSKIADNTLANYLEKV